METWSHPADYEVRELRDASAAVYHVDVLAHSSLEYGARAGPATIRSLELIPEAGTEEAWKAARLRLIWDSDSVEAASVDLPLGHAFGWVEGAESYQSLLLGQWKGTWYNRFPMPYRQQAILRIDTDKPLKGTIRVWTTPGVYEDAGSFHAALARG